MNIDFKQLKFVHLKLRELLAFVEDETGFDFTSTSLYRINDNGVHVEAGLGADNGTVIGNMYRSNTADETLASGVISSSSDSV